jgi:hypothetical protein
LPAKEIDRLIALGFLDDDAPADKKARAAHG